MNKKLIAVAVATIMAAPVAMADVKISGKFGVNFVNVNDDGAFGPLPAGAPAAAVQAYDDLVANYKLIGLNLTENAEEAGKAYRSFSEHGMNRVVVDGTSGKAFARFAFNNAGNNAAEGNRDQYVGYKAGFGTIQIGRMAGAIKNLEKDPYIATFLQARGSFGVAGGAYGSNGFVNNLVQYTTKASGMAVKVQLNPTSDTSTAGDEGHTAVSVVGKASGINWWFGYNNAGGSEATGSSSIKVGASMKFGKIKATAQMESQKYVDLPLLDGTGTVVPTDLDATRILLMADMGLGNGLSVNAAVGLGSQDVEGTSFRVAVNKELNKSASMFAGFRSDKPTDGDASNIFGAGMTVKF